MKARRGKSPPRNGIQLNVEGKCPPRHVGMKKKRDEEGKTPPRHVENMHNATWRGNPLHITLE